jgi:hypothetical protein
MAELALTGAATSSAEKVQSGFRLCALALLSSVLLQKLALPGTDGVFPLNLFVFPAITALAFLIGILEVNVAAFAWYSLFVLFGVLSSAASPSARVSALSLGLLLVAQFPLIFRVGPSGFPYRRLLAFVSSFGCICALIGVLQFAGQFVVGTRVAFLLDWSLPEAVAMKGFNSLIPLYWSSPVLKSNGVFFLEPSFFGQFLAIAVVAELLIGPRVLRLSVLTAGLVSSYSGTGPTMLALFLPVYFLRHGRLPLFGFAALLSVVVMFFGDVISIDAFTRRLSEFSDVQSSGWARFLSMFTVLQKVVFANDLTFFLGRGPGTVQEHFDEFSFYAFDPTWGKVIYEYGLVGSLIYFTFFYFAFVRGAKGLRFPVGYTYLFLGGYLLNPSVLMQVAALVVWLGDASTYAEHEATGARSPVWATHGRARGQLSRPGTQAPSGAE